MDDSNENDTDPEVNEDREMMSSEASSKGDVIERLLRSRRRRSQDLVGVMAEVTEVVAQTNGVERTNITN